MYLENLKKFKNLNLHLTLSQQRFVDESIKVLSIRNPNIINELIDIISSFKESKDKVSRGKQLVDYIFRIRYPTIAKKHKILNKIRYRLKQLGIKLSYDKLLEQDPKIVLPNGETVLDNLYDIRKIDTESKQLIDKVFEIFDGGL